MAATSCLIEMYFSGTQGKHYWQDLAIHLWKMVAACETKAEALELLNLIDNWVSDKNFVALKNFYQLTVPEPAQEP